MIFSMWPPFTLKEFRIGGETFILHPRSKNKQHQAIVLANDFQVQGVVVATIPKEGAL